MILTFILLKDLLTVHNQLNQYNAMFSFSAFHRARTQKVISLMNLELVNEKVLRKGLQKQKCGLIHIFSFSKLALEEK